MAEDFDSAFGALKSVLATYDHRLSVKADTSTEYSLVTKRASPFPQHKGHPMDFGSVRAGKAYVSFHLMPIYMSPPLLETISPALKKHMQGKTCFNFKSAPDPELIADLVKLTEAGFRHWSEKNWA
jgi:hypothetical protein